MIILNVSVAAVITALCYLLGGMPLLLAWIALRLLWGVRTHFVERRRTEALQAEREAAWAEREAQRQAAKLEYETWSAEQFRIGRAKFEATGGLAFIATVATITHHV